MCIFALTNELIATGGNDGRVEIIDVEKERIIKMIDSPY